MKKVLIVYAHPSRKWHNGHILKVVERELTNKKIQYEVLDLYKMKFDPLLKELEHFNFPRNNPLMDVVKIQQKIKFADKLIFISPVWWYSVPAILKGFFDRVFTSGFAYKYKILFRKLPLQYRLKYPKKLLKGKKAIFFLTSGSPKFLFWLSPLISSPIRTIKGTLQFFCGIKTKFYHFGNAYTLNDTSKKKLEKIAIKGINKNF